MLAKFKVRVFNPIRLFSCLGDGCLGDVGCLQAAAVA